VHSFLHDHPFLDKHSDKVSGVLSSFDRVIVRGYLPLTYAKGKKVTATFSNNERHLNSKLD